MRLEWLARRPALLVVLHALAFWPVWRWYGERLGDGGDERWALVALGAAAFVSWPARGVRFHPRDPRLAFAAALTLIYAVAVPFAPPLLRAVLAMSALAATWCSVADARAKLWPMLGLLVLSLPVIESLQFYAGYPLRLVSAAGATTLLDLAQLDVTRVGTNMSMGRHLVLVDAPCSGVRMLWTGCVLVCVLAAQRERPGFRALALAGLLAVPLVVAANSLRAAMLFVLEARAAPTDGFWHAAVGVASFTLVALLLYASERIQVRWFAPPVAPRAPRCAVPS
jgi:exosortase/archaeosortase family protein